MRVLVYFCVFLFLGFAWSHQTSENSVQKESVHCSTPSNVSAIGVGSFEGLVPNTVIDYHKMPLVVHDNYNVKPLETTNIDLKFGSFSMNERPSRFSRAIAMERIKSENIENNSIYPGPLIR